MSSIRTTTTIVVFTATVKAVILSLLIVTIRSTGNTIPNWRKEGIIGNRMRLAAT